MSICGLKDWRKALSCLIHCLLPCLRTAGARQALEMVAEKESVGLAKVIEAILDQLAQDAVRKTSIVSLSDAPCTALYYGSLHDMTAIITLIPFFFLLC